MTHFWPRLEQTAKEGMGYGPFPFFITLICCKAKNAKNLHKITFLGGAEN